MNNKMVFQMHGNLHPWWHLATLLILTDPLGGRSSRKLCWTITLQVLMGITAVVNYMFSCIIWQSRMFSVCHNFTNIKVKFDFILMPTM